MTTTCFRTFLHAEWQRRRAANPRYSLRAFARRLSVNHSTLSQWMRGQRPLTGRTIEALGTRLGLNPAAVRVFVEHRGAAGPDLAILELTHRPGFHTDSRWVARELRTSVDQVNVALHRLLRLGLLEMTADRWIDRSEALR